MISPHSRRSMMIALGGLALVALLTFRALALHPTDLLVGPQRGGANDVTFYSLAAQGFAGKELREHGAFPLWNPYKLAGAPFVGYPQSAWLYPPNWLFLGLDPWPLTGWLLVLHHFWAGIGTYLLCRRFELSPTAAFAGGAAFLAAPYLLAHTGEGHYNNVAVVSWYPWAFLAFERLRRGAAWAGPALAGCLALAFFAGHVQEWYYLVLAIGSFMALEVIARVRRSGVKSALRIAIRFALFLTLSIGLSAAELLPSWIYAQQSARSAGAGIGEPGAIGLGLANLKQLLDPTALGGPEFYRGPGLYYWETLAYAGVLLFVFACAGVALRSSRREVKWFAGLWSLAFLCAFGDGSPVFAALRFLPGMGWFRAPSRTLFLCALAVAILAAFGLDALASAIRSRRWLSRRGTAGLVFGLAALSTAELVTRSSIFLDAAPHDARRENPAIETLSERAGRYRTIAPLRLVSDWEAWSHDLHKVQSYEGNPPTMIAAAIETTEIDKRDESFILRFETLDLAALHQPLVDLLAIRFAVTGSPQAVEGSPWRLVERGRMPDEVTLRGRSARELDYFLYENSSALPRSFALGRVRVRGSDDPVSALRAIDPRRELLLEQDVLPPGDRTGFTPAEIIDYRPNRVVAEVELPEPGYLFLSDTWYPGWKAHAGERELPVLRANLAFRAVPLGPGSHRVVFSYRPVGLWPAILLSALSLAALLYLGFRVDQIFPSRSSTLRT